MWEEKISQSLRIPDDFGVGEFPDNWTEVTDHTGPEGSSPLKAALIDKTQSALYAVYSGVLIWASRRLQHMTDTKSLEELAVALFCYQHDPAYLTSNRPRPRLLEISTREKYEATVLYFEYAIFYERWSNNGDWPLFPNFAIVADAINLTRHHLGVRQRTLFDPWVEGIIVRMNALAPLPQHSEFRWDMPKEQKPAQRLITMGPPIPPQALDLSAGEKSIDLSKASREFLQSVDWKNNRFLKRPEDVSLRFSGQPYRDPR